MEDRKERQVEVSRVDEQPAAPRLILASNSPRRKDLLECLGLSFSIIPSRFEEDMTIRLKPAELVVSLASSKAREVAGRILAEDAVFDKVAPLLASDTADSIAEGAQTLILGADTIVVLNDQVLGKPVSNEDACRMLAVLSGQCHQVYTGIAIVELPSRRIETSFEVSNVHFRCLDEAEIESYVATGEPMDKAGAYALQGIGSAFVEKIDGCFTNVIGISVPAVVQMLRQFGVPVLGLASIEPKRLKR